MKNINDSDLLLNLDPEENLRMENQFLELKLKAEFGAETFASSDLPADIENQFLKNVLEFEKSFSQSRENKVSDILGNPFMKPEAELDDLRIELYLNRVNKMLLEKNIAVDFGGEYSNRVKYKFITEELFEASIFPAGIPGMIMHFSYEEFHPDHAIDLEKKARKFISGWFDKDIEKLLWELADYIILPNGTTLGKEKVSEKLNQAFSRYSHFSEYKHLISDVTFAIDDESGNACVEGVVSYNALMAKNEAIAIQGSFKLYFCREYGWWNIYFFVLPGFEFNEDKPPD